MAIRTIIQYPHDSLRKISPEITKDQIASKEFQLLLDDLLETLENEYPLGAGLSGCQIDELYRVFVINMEVDNETFIKQFFINPEITSRSKESDIDWEGCLSFNGPDGTPDQWGKVKRASSIVMTALDRKGQRFTVNANGFYSRLLQHELDHLNGVLFIDKLESDLVDTAELERRIQEETLHRAA